MADEFAFFFFDAAGDAQTFVTYAEALDAAKREAKSETVDVIVRHFPSKNRAAMVGARVAKVVGHVDLSQRERDAAAKKNARHSAAKTDAPFNGIKGLGGGHKHRFLPSKGCSWKCACGARFTVCICGKRCAEGAS